MSTLAEKERYAKYIEIQNPFDLKSRIEKDIIVNQKPTVSDLLPNKVNDYVVAISGKIIESHEWDKTIINEGDCLIFSPVPQGGGDNQGKNIVRIVLIIAIAYFAPGLATQAGATAGSAHAAATAAITIAGSMLVNHLIPIEASLPEVESLGDSPSYGYDGPKNTAKEGVSMPVVYGNYIQAGNLINVHIENTEDGDQDLFLRFALSEGEVQYISPSSILINGQPKDNFRSVRTWHSLGDPNGQVYSDDPLRFLGFPDFDLFPPGLFHPFNSSKTAIPVNATLDTNFTERETTVEVDALRIDFLVPYGLRKITDEGKSKVHSIDLIIEYRSFTERDNSDPWTTLASPNVEGNIDTVYVYTHHSSGKERDDYLYRNELLSYFEDDDYVIDGVIWHQNYEDDQPIGSPVSVGYVIDKERQDEQTTISGLYATPHRFSYRIDDLDEDFYEVRIRRANSEDSSEKVLDTINWVDLVEVVRDRVKLKHTAWLGLKIRLDEQLSSIPSVTVKMGGRKIKAITRDVATGDFSESIIATSNPAWIAYDILTHPRIGAGIPEASIDLHEWIDWAEYCEAESLEFNGVFDRSIKLWDAIRYVTRAGRAQLVNVGTKFTVVIEKPEQPSCMFSVANIIEDSFNITWTPISNRANEIEVTFYDRLDDFKPNIIRVTDSNVPGTASTRRAQLNLIGVTDATQAINEAYLQLNQNKYIQQVVSFDVPTEAIINKVGDVILVQHDIPQWGYSGRCGSGSTSYSVELDSVVDYDSEKSYELLVHYSRIDLGTYTISNVVNSKYVFLSGLPSSGTPKRLFVNGIEYEIEAVIDVENGGPAVVVSDIPNTVVGGSATISDTDSVVTTQVSGVISDENYSTVQLSSPLPSDPSIYTKWMYGEVDKSSKPFRIVGIDGDSDMVRTITATEYNDSIYSGGEAVPTPNYSSLTPHVNHVSDFQIHQDGYIKGNVYSPIVFLSWVVPDDNRYKGCKVLMRYVNEVRWRTLAELSFNQSTYEYHDGALGDEVEFAVVSNGTLGYAPQKSAPSQQITIVNPPPPDVDTLFITDGKLSWTYLEPPLDLAGYEIRYHGGTRDTWSDATPVHTGILTSSPYDVSALAIEQVTFLIKAIDTSGNYSDNAAVVTVNIGSNKVNNALLTVDMKNDQGSWIDNIVSGTKNPSFEIEATQSGYFYSDVPDTNFYSADGNSDFYATQYNPVEYEITINVDPADIGSSMVFEFETNGFSTTPQIKPDSASQYSNFNGRLKSADESSYEVRLKIPAYYGTVIPTITEARYILDVDDIVEAFEDLSIDAAGTRLPITQTYRAIKHVSLTMQSDGSGVSALKVVDKDNVNGPLIQAYDSAGVAVSTTIDAYVRGY